ncbi:MAG: UDP-N-acetylmuramoyl-L-alanyl-D-glutamate--2,6-diaminopimelate ligase [Nitrospirota bacterium]|nr:UDP-N-acetylmuramoyl-L-alanyl-D-glutamate--2,6-diaminopimelate ligase [Nitrospirota bacterium]MDH4359427.1 UDP-N-acetylmuramoyl-L-alanyl-D-glutamate--2,6-diaminopimelate ligase [Nitrospirota bacterium]MDH5296237.1 UDP-N-acetylmuramoyl-L-alanyl-D-glutamate--2,6-diaminopimelate ligase [Nitrospirota bacterium]MDH5574806.1 UDP-N-acetylmuramoyl-L-alanyl-D-glutamate--2,6-diaminopimelate ligase [Nitrospirota bacterium]
MTLRELVASLDSVMVQGDLQCEVMSITEDSRQVKPGSVFVAIKGEHQDGHQFVRQAQSQGAVGVVVEEGFERFEPPQGGRSSVLIRVKNSRKALGLLASRLYDMPSAHLQMVGVTGTNGKTTVTYLAKSLLEAQGHHVGLLGTVGYVFGTEHRAASHTTPASVELQGMLNAMVKAGMDVAVMEVSSHALALDRVAGCEFDIVVFTNLTQDHLDFHRTLDEYFQAKVRLFTECVEGKQKTGPKRALVNADDERAPMLLQRCSIPTWTFGLHAPADIQAEDIRLSMGGTEFLVNSPLGRLTISSQLVGEHNVSNMLAAIGIGLEMGMTVPMIERALQSVANVPGRFERIDEGQAFTVVVDYAHTEDALYRLLRAAQAIKQGRIITLFGCGGDRDSGKRPKMGQVASRHSDLVIVTSDNPRTENPHTILSQIEQGIQSLRPEERCPYRIISDRAEAIHAAVAEAKPGDLVLIAGKGHEDYQILGTQKIHFDDREEARKAIHQQMGRA